MKFAKIVFWAAGIWGVLILTPLFFIFNSIGRNDPPPITHTGFYYGFATVGLAFQLAFIVIATDDARVLPAQQESCSEGHPVRLEDVKKTPAIATEYSWHYSGVDLLAGSEDTPTAGSGVRCLTPCSSTIV